VKLDADTLKFAGGAVIIAAAACIMLPDVLNYIGGLWRLGVMIVVVLFLAWLMANIVARIQLSRKSKLVKESKSVSEESS
jgi:hypothetical protein